MTRQSLLINATIFLVGLFVGSNTKLLSGGINLSYEKNFAEQHNVVQQTETKAVHVLEDSKHGSHNNTSMFDKMHKHLYKIANEPRVMNRKPFSLGAVAVTGGGLDDSDRQLLAKLYYNATSVYEFGLGESTHIAAHVGVPRYSGVDSDAVWVGKAREGANMDHFRFSFADIGNTASFGNPTNNKLKKIPVGYQSAPLNNEMEAFEFYLVDGRYRVSCACASFLHAMSRGGDMSRVMVAVHDWSREFYWVVKEVADVVHTSNALGVMKLKPNATEHDIFKIWESHVWDQR